MLAPDDLALRVPYLTTEFPGVGGTIKAEPDDFEVEEIPSYLPCGTGEHLFAFVEKRSMGAEFFQRQLATRLELSPRDIGIAGMKDRHAITRQWVSVPYSPELEAKLPTISGDGITILETDRHTNKLKIGHLKGNRFRILIRDADRTHAPAVDAMLDKLRTFGMPNYYGPQRFGHDGETVNLGLRAIKGERINARGPRLRLYLSAAQSLVFNRIVAVRHTEGLLRTVVLGDVMMKRPFGGIFNAHDLGAEQPRYDRNETVVAGPMPGKKTFPAREVALARELDAIAHYGLSVSDFRAHGKSLPGARRPMLVMLEELSAEWDTLGLRLTFSLPAGSYATILLRELMKSAGALAADGGSDREAADDADDGEID